MRKVLFTTLILMFIHNILFAQKERSTKKTTTVTDSVKWKAQHYIINRDSAYANPRYAIKKLQGGNRRFIEGLTIRPRQDINYIKKLEKEQQPFAIIVGCSDSRVPNEMIFDQGLGDLFIIRTAGQVSAAASYGSMEFAVLKLKTKLIVVLGHTKCGAVEAAVHRKENVPGHIVTLINDIKPAVAKSSHLVGDPVDNAVRQNVIDQVNVLRDLDPILHKKYSDGEILIIGAIYDINSGKVEFLNETLISLPQPKSNMKH
jgi:carbonic anhydrase